MKAPTRQEQGYRLSSGTFRRLMAREGTETMISATALPPIRLPPWIPPPLHRRRRRRESAAAHIQHFAIGINGHAAHGVVHAGAMRMAWNGLR